MTSDTSKIVAVSIAATVAGSFVTDPDFRARAVAWIRSRVSGEEAAIVFNDGGRP